MKLLTNYDKGRERVEMDVVRKKYRTYAKRRDDTQRFIHCNFINERTYIDNKTYEPYEKSGETDEKQQFQFFDEKTSKRLFDGICKRRIVPIVVNRAKGNNLDDKERKEVDRRMMYSLQKWAFKEEEAFIAPLLADNIDEATDLLGKTMLKSGNKLKKKRQVYLKD